MPRVPIDYSKTIIYRIVCKDITIKDCYIGSTTDFKSRKFDHKCNCNDLRNKKSNYKVYQFIRDKGGFENWDMIEVEKYNAIDKLDADKRERYWLEFYQATLNKCIPSRTMDEWVKDNKDILSVKKKIYYEENKEVIAKKLKIYREKHRDEKNEYLRNYRQEYQTELNCKANEKYHRNKEENREETNRKERERYHRKKEQKLMCLEDKV